MHSSQSCSLNDVVRGNVEAPELAAHDEGVALRAVDVLDVAATEDETSLRAVDPLDRAVAKDKGVLGGIQVLNVPIDKQDAPVDPVDEFERSSAEQQARLNQIGEPVNPLDEDKGVFDTANVNGSG